MNLCHITTLIPNPTQSWQEKRRKLERAVKRPKGRLARPPRKRTRRPQKENKQSKQRPMNGAKERRITARSTNIPFSRNKPVLTVQREAAAAKAAEAERKRAEKKALEDAELAALPSKPKAFKKPAKPPAGPKKGLDLDQLDGEPTNTKGSALNATGIDNALDALDLTSNSQDSVDRHPERRFKAAYAVFEERRLEEMKDEKGLRRNQKIAEIRKEFEKHPDNPFNQVAGRYDMTKEELKEVAAAEKKKTEDRLAGSTI